MLNFLTGTAAKEVIKYLRAIGMMKKKNNKLVLSQIGDIAGRGNFILAFHQRLARRKKNQAFTLYALSFYLLTFMLRYIVLLSNLILKYTQTQCVYLRQHTR